MKNLIISFLFLLTITSCSVELTKEQSTQLHKLYKEKDYFKLDKLMSSIGFDSGNPELLLYKAMLDNVFNQPEESNRLIDVLLNKHAKCFNDSILRDLYDMKESNAYRLQDYETGFIADSIIVAQYSHVSDSADLDDRKVDLGVYRILRHAPKMEINARVGAKAKFKRDIAKLQNVSVCMQKDSVDFVFDTGAAYSVIIESLAKKYGVKMLEGLAQTGTSTGIKVACHLGLLNLNMGDIEVKNMVVLVLPDSALTFANGIYVIRGVIGFPTMYALKAFTIKDKKELIVSKGQENRDVRNFAIDGQYIILKVQANNDTLPFIFDSGANFTELSALFFNKYKNSIVEKCRKEVHTAGGAGGTVDVETYIMDSLTVSAGNSSHRLDSLHVYPNDLNSEMKTVYGNFGQDYVGKFSKMTIDFTSMDITFSDLKK